MQIKDDNELFVFADETEDDLHVPYQDNPWTILIVDDEPDVHQVTEFALRGILVFNRPLEYLHAYSAKEGISVLNAHPEVCVGTA